MTMSSLALTAKRVIENAWLHGAPYDLASQAAFALESAQLLQSPETAAESAVSADAVRLAEESVAELRREHEENARLRERIAELEALKPATIQTCRACGAGYTYGKPCSTCAFRKGKAIEADRIVAYRDPHNPRVLLCREHGERWQGVYPVTSEDLPDGGICTFGRLSSLTCGRDVLVVAGQRTSLEDPHDGPLAHTYRLGRDLPELGSV